MATEIPGAVESGPSEFTQTLHDVTTDKSIALLGNMHATIQGKFERCREALLVSDPDLDREALISAKGKRAPGTCEWIVEDPHYKSWLAREFPILQISGRPGTGKTMLSLFLTEKLAERCGQENEQLLFFYCRFQDERFNNRQNVLRNIICQLLEFSKPDCQQVKDVLRDFESPKKTNDILSSFEALWGIVKKLLSQPGLPTIWCIIDGMDECQSFEKLQGELYDYCRACGQQDGESKLQLLILGRQNDDYNASHVIKLDEDHQNRIKNDVECFIISGLEPLERIPEFAQIRDDVTRMLFEKAEGTFLWSNRFPRG
ncbi:hypothetical protein NW766_008622 [Fusarium irregulare]|uniref:Nephrocystin 3-like N-terminal domain-containing protein n=1 Tax=Fusarium irregulare TaxID=2494466 RepID=A0A9W8PKV2_9HYPO|nr:hypothetical protein NW766_008622 [Fusarium irregulare]